MHYTADSIMWTGPELERWEERFAALLPAVVDSDSAHGRDHVERVVASAKRLGREESAEPAVVVPAAWLHDCVLVEKARADRRRASTVAAARARRELAVLGYPERHLDGIAHAIEAHSFAAGIEPRTIEARVVQDADRLDALGAVGLARCLMVGGRLGRPLYDAADPFCLRREPDDGRATLDHLFAKLLQLPATMKTAAGKAEAERRAGFLRLFLSRLEEELGWAE